MKPREKLLRGMLLGAGAMYFLHPDRGARRRSLVRDQLVHAGHQVGEGVPATAHDTAEGVSSLQGQGHPLGGLSTLQRWVPSVRLALGALGSMVALKGFRRRGLAGNALAGAGVGLLARAAQGPLGGIPGTGTTPAPIEVEKTIRVNAPLEEVWEIWSNFEHFPRFMSHLREVRRTYKNRSHWVAAGPAGMPVEWDAIVTEWVPNESVGWRSMEGSTVDTAGRAALTSMPNGDIQIDVRLSYIPPTGPLGHALAALFGEDPEHALEKDLRRLQSLLEEGQ